MSSLQGTKECPQTGGSFFDNRFELDGEDDFIIVSVRMYKFFMAHGKDGLDAKALYDHLVFASRVQGTKSVKANISYIKKGLGWGIVKIKKAKAFLKAAGLIEYSQNQDDLGQFQGQKILIKSRWDAESLQAWIDKKSHQKEEELTGGIETVPPVENPEIIEDEESDNTPDMGPLKKETLNNRWYGLPTTGPTVPPVSRHNYKGVINKEGGGYNSKAITTRLKEPESNNLSDSEPPPPDISEKKNEKKGLFSEVQDQIRSIIGSEYKLSDESKAMIRELHELTSSGYVLQIVSQLLEDKRSKSSPWLNRYANQDLKERLSWGIRTQAAKQQKTVKHQVLCPCCNTVFIGSNTACSICGFDKQDIDLPDKIKDHILWMKNRDAVSPFSFTDDDMKIKIISSLNEYSATVHVFDLEDHLIIAQGLKLGRDPVMRMWNEVLKKLEHKARHSSGVYWPIGLMKIRTHVDAVSKLPDEAFFPKQKDLFDETG